MAAALSICAASLVTVAGTTAAARASFCNDNAHAVEGGVNYCDTR